VHYCLGAGFAQTYGGVLLPRLFARFPGLRMVTRPEYRPSLMLRTYDHMPVRLN
jgi:cytochrome P450